MCVAQIDQCGTSHRVDLEDPAGARFREQPGCMIWSVLGRVHAWDNWDNATGLIKNISNSIFWGCTTVEDDVHESK